MKQTQANRMAHRYFKNHNPEALTWWNYGKDPIEYDPSEYWLLARPRSPLEWLLLLF